MRLSKTKTTGLAREARRGGAPSNNKKSRQKVHTKIHDNIQ